MNYGKIPRAMWLIFRGSLSRAAEAYLGVADGKALMKAAKPEYRAILAGVPEFDKDSRFAMNIYSCAMLLAVLKQLQVRPSLEATTAFYRAGLCDNALMQKFARRKGTYTPEGQAKLAAQAKASEARTNPYEWKFAYEAGESVNEYAAIFHTCGILRLMTEHGYGDLVGAMCAADYDMAALNNTVFTREYTLATGGPYCDCHYSHKEA